MVNYDRQWLVMLQGLISKADLMLVMVDDCWLMMVMSMVTLLENG